MDKSQVSHIGIAVTDLNEALNKYNLLSDADAEITEVPDQKVRVAIFGHSGGRIELLEPTSDDSPIAKFIKSKGEGLHHICIYVDDIEAKLSELKDAGVRLIDETPRIGAEGNKIAFVHPKDMNSVLIELEERVKP